jgi:hypothetical protein
MKKSKLTTCPKPLETLDYEFDPTPNRDPETQELQHPFAKNVGPLLSRKQCLTPGKKRQDNGMV